MYKEKIRNLLHEIRECGEDDPELKEDLLDVVERGLKSFINYVNSVYSMETTMTLARFRANSPKEFQEMVQGLDASRRTAHDAAIGGINAMDRLCNTLGIEPIYGGSQDRNDIGDFCGNIVDEYFENRSTGRVIAKMEAQAVIDEEMEFER